jgi:hypothetical protein
VGGWGTLLLREAATGKEIRKFNGYASWGLAIAPGGQFLAASDSQKVRLWDASTGKLIGQIPRQGIWSPTFSPDGKILACAADNQISLWEVTSAKEVRQFQKQEGKIWCLAFSPDGQTLASGSFDQTIRLWDVASGKVVGQLQGHRGMVNSVSFSPDGKTLVSGSEDATVRLWELSTGQEIAQFRGHTGPVRAVTFSPEGRFLASGSADTTLLVWDRTGRMLQGRIPTVELAGKELEALWVDLAGPDAKKAQQGLWTLVAGHKQAVPFLKVRLGVLRVDLQRIAPLLADLDSDRFDARRKATEALEKLADLAEPALRHVLAGKPSLEVRQRVELILKKSDGKLPNYWRALRALEALEQIGTPEAREVFEALADGTSGNWLNQEARAVLQRLAKRPGAW